MLIGKKNYVISDIVPIDIDGVCITTETGIELSLSADEVNMISYTSRFAITKERAIPRQRAMVYGLAR